MRIAIAGGTGTVGHHAAGAAERGGHEVVVISRSRGIDAQTGEGLAQALVSVDAVIDATNMATLEGFMGGGTFFTDVAHHLQQAGADQGVQRIVTLSIVGIDRAAGFAYYGAKVRHEQAALDGPVPATIVRATQFHQFAGQVLERTKRGPVALVPNMVVQPVAAEAVGRVLVEHATGAASGTPVETGQGTAYEVAGPAVTQVVPMARSLLRHRQQRAVVVPLFLPGAAARAMRSGALLPSEGARIEGPTFERWLAAGGDEQLTG